jgi:hypothetical protein
MVLDAVGDADPVLARDALLTVSELVSNVMVHTADGCTVHAGYVPTGFRIEVTDTSADLPVVSHADEATHAAGRGLAIVDTVAARWGATVHGGGKTVWAELAVR